LVLKGRKNLLAVEGSYFLSVLGNGLNELKEESFLEISDRTGILPTL